jgi:hypothetical protein
MKKNMLTHKESKYQSMMMYPDPLFEVSGQLLL